MNVFDRPPDVNGIVNATVGLVWTMSKDDREVLIEIQDLHQQWGRLCLQLERAGVGRRPEIVRQVVQLADLIAALEAMEQDGKITPVEFVRGSLPGLRRLVATARELAVRLN